MSQQEATANGPTINQSPQPIKQASFEHHPPPPSSLPHQPQSQSGGPFFAPRPPLNRIDSRPNFPPHQQQRPPPPPFQNNSGPQQHQPPIRQQQSIFRPPQFLPRGNSFSPPGGGGGGVSPAPTGTVVINHHQQYQQHRPPFRPQPVAAFHHRPPAPSPLLGHRPQIVQQSSVPTFSNRPKPNLEEFQTRSQTLDSAEIQSHQQQHINKNDLINPIRSNEMDTNQYLPLPDSSGTITNALEQESKQLGFTQNQEIVNPVSGSSMGHEVKMLPEQEENEKENPISSIKENTKENERIVNGGDDGGIKEEISAMKKIEEKHDEVKEIKGDQKIENSSQPTSNNHINQPLINEHHQQEQQIKEEIVAHPKQETTDDQLELVKQKEHEEMKKEIDKKQESEAQKESKKNELEENKKGNDKENTIDSTKKDDLGLKLSPESNKGDTDSGVDESTQGNDQSCNGDNRSGRKQSKTSRTTSSTTPTKGRSLSRGSKTPSSLQSPESAVTTPGSAEKKKIPMNKIQVGAAPSPNLKVVKSKIGSLDNAKYKPGGGQVKIENKKLDFKQAGSRIEAKNEKYAPKGGEKKELNSARSRRSGTSHRKIISQKLEWNAKSKIGSLNNTSYKPQGGDKKIETVKLDFKEKAKPKVGSKENMKYQPGGGDVKIENRKLEINATSKVGSLDNVKHKPLGGDKKIFDDKEYIRQQKSGKSSIEHSLSGSQQSIQSQEPPQMAPVADENLNQQH